MRRSRTALVTGGTRGLGSAIAEALRSAGYGVVVTGTTAGGCPPRGCRYLACDFEHPQEVEGLARACARLRPAILVNNAGINKIGPLQTYALADFERIHRVNVMAPYRLCQAVLPEMRRSRFGRIVNITSIFGLVSRAGRSAYSASKFGVFGFSRALALEVAADNVLVNCLAPGFVDTDMTRRILGAKGMAEMARRIPMRRLAQPEEIARYVRFLVSEENTYLTGQTIIVDGGFVSE